jgi:tetratricopeptide (TPR) repeat protein
LRYLLTCIILLVALTGRTQPSDQQLAVHYYQNGEYDKAHMYFEKLYEASPTSFFYQYLLKCKLELKDYKEAEKLIKKQQKREPRNLSLYLDLSGVYTALGDDKKAKQENEKAIKELTPDYNQVVQLGDAFRNRNMLDEALMTFSKGEQLLGSQHSFATNMAELYAQKADYTKMFQTYFDLLDYNPSYLTIVQNSLSTIINFEDPNDTRVEVLRTEILKRVQKDPSSEPYTDMMVWYFQQKGDFNNAFNQVKALDKRLKLEGQKAIDFAMLCVNNDQYDIAAKAYDYVVQLGNTAPYYFIAQNGLINVLYKQVVNKGYYTTEELNLLETNCAKVIQEFGDVSETVTLKIKLAHIQGFYQHRTQDAIDLLTKTLETPALTESQKGDLKMELADLLLLAGNIWDASLYYSQVEKAFKHDVIGHEAKYRNAKVFYYSHDYKWSQSQLDVLKTSTSKLIANDALSLSLLITENIGLDSLPEPLNLYSDAELLFFQNKDEEALQKLDTLTKQYTFHSLGDDAIFLRFKIAKKRGAYDNAKKYLEEILAKFPTDVLGDDAVFNLAEMYQYHYKDNDKAAEMYKKILFDYPGSLYQVEARKRFRILRGEKIN